ncbi:MAG: D-glycero-beta-D-manno-heptose 1-phosphate adenylyltransferase [Planctomycetota bacterium]
MSRAAPRRPADVLRALAAPRLVVVGDLLLDRYVEGRVDRISPEAPIQVLDVKARRELLGGAGFTARAAAVLGAAVRLVGVVGADAAGDRVRQMAADAGLTWSGVVDASRPTSVKTRMLARNHNTAAQQVLRVDEESRRALDAYVEAALVGTLREAIATADAVLVNDYGKGLLTPVVLDVAVREARARGVAVVVDPHKGSDVEGYRGATAFTPNRSETERTTGLRVASVEQAGAAGAQLARDLRLDVTLVTLDRDGMLLAWADGSYEHVPTTPREVFDVTGAGDVVLATFGIALASGATPREAAELANIAAGLEVERVGVVPITREEIAARLVATAADTLGKVVDRSELPALRARLADAGRQLVFTNGCFDLLHAGHVRYLARAKAEGDVLVVGVNDDESVRRLKGEGRPVNTLGDRLEVLAGLAAVDHLVAFHEDTPAALVAALQPDVLVKGADWKDKGVVGSDVVTARGGRVVLVDLLEGRSTTGLVERIRTVEATPSGDARQSGG